MNKVGRTGFAPHNLEELASLFMSRRSQSESNKPVLPHCMQLWLVRMQAACTTSLQLYSTQRSPKVTPNPPGHNLSSTVFKGLYSKSSATEATYMVCHTVCASRMRWPRGECTHLDLVLQSLQSSPPTVLHIKLLLYKPSRVHSAVNSKTCSVRSRKRGGCSDRFNGKTTQVAFTLFTSALRKDQKLTFQHEEAEMQVICHYPLKIQNSLKKTLQRMVY